MKLVSIKEIAELLSSTRETVGKKLSGLPFQDGTKGAKLYNSDVAIRVVLGLGGGEEPGAAITAQEASRQLTIARKQQIDLEMEVTRKDRIPLGIVEEINDRVFSNVAGLLKAHEGKTLTAQGIGDIYTEMRGVGPALKEALK